MKGLVANIIEEKSLKQFGRPEFYFLIPKTVANVSIRIRIDREIIGNVDLFENSVRFMVPTVFSDVHVSRNVRNKECTRTLPLQYVFRCRNTTQ